MARSAGKWPLPRCDPDSKPDPVELLVDITYVLALSQAAGLIRQEPGMAGVLHAVAALACVVLLWQGTANTTAMAVLTAGPLKLLQIAQTGVFLACAVSIPEAFVDRSGDLDGRVVFAAALTAAAVCGAAQWVLFGASVASIRRNTATMMVAYASFVALVWASVGAHGGAKTAMMFGGYAAGVTSSTVTCLPIYRWCRIGHGPGWSVTGARACADRFAASYTVACCLSLELLEQVGQAATISVTMVVMVLAALGTAYLLYRLYEPLVERARQVHDPRDTSVSLGRKIALTLFGYDVGHLMMCGGLVVAAGAARTIFADVFASAGHGLGYPVATSPLVELYGGIVACLMGQAVFSFATDLSVDILRVGTSVVLIVAIPVLDFRPALIPVIVVLAVCAALRILDIRRRTVLTPAIQRDR
jgi:low temperature requirement protein LtrA